MSKAKSGENMMNQSPTIDTSVEKNSDPLPWLIQVLLEKQADHSRTNQTNPTTEPPKESP